MDTVSMLNKMSFYCQPILPLVYDESMSYYETLCKVVGQLNTTGETVNKLNEGLTGEIADRQAADASLDARIKQIEETNRKIHFLKLDTIGNLLTPDVTRENLSQWIQDGDLIAMLYAPDELENSWAVATNYRCLGATGADSMQLSFYVPISVTNNAGKSGADVAQEVVVISLPVGALTNQWKVRSITSTIPNTNADGFVNLTASVGDAGAVTCDVAPGAIVDALRNYFSGTNQYAVAVNARLTYDGKQYHSASAIVKADASGSGNIRIEFENYYNGVRTENGVGQMNTETIFLVGDVSTNAWSVETIDHKAFDFSRYEGFQFTRGENDVITANDESTPNAVYAQYHSDTSGKIYQNLPVRLIDTVDNAEYWNGVFDIKDNKHMTFTFVTSNYATASGKMLVRVIELSADVNTTTWKYADKEFELPITSSGEKYLVESTAISEGEYDAVRKKTDYYITFNKTNNEIIEALNSGKDIQFKLTLTEGNDSYPVYFSVGYTRVDVFNNVPAYMFVGSLGELDQSVITVYGVTDSSETFRPYLTTTGGILPEPNPDDSDDGKVLAVNKHKWELKTPTGGATDEQVEAAVSEWLTAHPEATTTVQDGAITKEKIHDNAVGAHELDIDFSNNISTLPDNPNVIKVATGWEANLNSLRQSQTYPNGVLWTFHCEAGKCYRLQSAYEYKSPRASLFTQANPDNVANLNNNGTGSFICDQMITPKAGRFNTQDGYIAGAWYFGLPQGLDPVYATIFNNVSDAYARAEFRCEKDFWMYWLSASDVSADVPYIGGSDNAIREITEPPQAVLENGGWFTTTVANSATYLPPYAKSFSGYAKEKSGGETSEDSVHGIRRYVLPKDITGAFARSSRDPADYRINALLIGDSITYAASNAGLQNAWRKYISTRLNIGEIELAVSGTGIIKGAPFDFKGNAKGSEAYSEDMSGYPGIVHWVNSYLGKESTFEFPGTNAYARNLRMQRSSIAIIALGTNDWGANSVLGSVDTIGDETTFYGAVQKTYTFLHDEVGIPSVLFVAPFQREGWSQSNQATAPYTIYDMCHALSEIACINTDMYVLDCLDRWYLNYDDEAIRSKSFIDGVHIKPYAHHLFTIDLAKEIRAILSTKGIV